MVVYKDLELQIFTLDEKLGLLRTPYYEIGIGCDGIDSVSYDENCLLDDRLIFVTLICVNTNESYNQPDNKISGPLFIP